MMKKILFIIALISIISVILPLPVNADDTLVKINDKITVVKEYPIMQTMGETTYGKLYHTFEASGTITVFDDYGNKLILQIPVFDTQSIKRSPSLQLFQNGGLVFYKYSLTVGSKSHESFLFFDFVNFSNKVKITLSGDLPGLSNTIKFPLTIVGDRKEENGRVWSAQTDNKGNIVSGVGFDWRDAPTAVSVSSDISFTVGNSFNVDPSTIATTTNSVINWLPNQRKTFYYNGLHWAFYSDLTDMKVKTSADGTSWSAASTVRTTCAYGYDFSIAFDGTYGYYAYRAATANTPIYFRRFIPEGNGTLTFSAAEQIAVAAAIGTTYYYPTIAVSTTGYPMVGYAYWIGAIQLPYVSMASTNDGTWATAAGFPYALSAVNDIDWCGIIPTPLASGRMLVVYGRNTHPSNSQTWDGAAWEAEKTLTLNIESGIYTSLTSLEDTAHYVFLEDATYDIHHEVYTDAVGNGTWGAANAIAAAAATSSAPVVSIVDTGDVYCFWSNSNHVYYKKYAAGSWDVGATDWITETTILQNDSITSVARSYGWNVGMMYERNAVAPFDIRYSFLALTPITVPVITVNAASSISTTTARINSTVTDDGGAACDVRFGWGNVSRTAANFDLYGNITAWVGGYTTGQHPYVDLTGLTPGMTYYYRAQIRNWAGNMTSVAEISFTTDSGVGGISNLRAIPRSDTEMSLFWTRQAGAASTMIRYRTDTYPGNNTDGAEVYDGISQSYFWGGTEAGKTYWFAAFGHTGTTYATGNVSYAIATSLATGDTGDTYDTSTGGGDFFRLPDATALAGIPPLYNWGNTWAASMGMDSGWFWLLGIVLISIILGAVLLAFTHSIVVGYIGVMAELMVGAQMGLVPIWMLLIMGIMAGLFILKERLA